MPRYDVYGRMRVLVTRDPSGRRRLERVAPDDKRRLLPDVPLPDEAAESEIPGFLEAAFHEMGRPRERITRLD